MVPATGRHGRLPLSAAICRLRLLIVAIMTFTPLQNYPEFVLRHRWVILLAATLIMLPMASGVRFIETTHDHRAIFGKDDPYIAAFDALEQTYTQTNTALIAVVPRTESVFSKRILRTIEEMTEDAWLVPHSIRVDSLANYAHTMAEGDDLIVESLVDRDTQIDDTNILRIRQIALTAPDIAGRLVSMDGRVAGIAIRFAMPEDTGGAVIEISDYIDSMLDASRALDPNIDYYVTGDVILGRAFAEANNDDVELLPLMFLVIVIITGILLRSVLATVAVVVTLMYIVNTAMGFSGWVGTVFTPASSGTPVIITTVAVAHAIHVASKTLLGMGRGLDRQQAIVESIRSNIWPVFLSSITTGIGFLTLNASEAPPFRDVGNLVAFGVLCAFVFSMTLLPAMLSVLPIRGRHRVERTDYFDRLSSFVIARSRFLIWSVTALALVLSMGIWRIELTDNFTKHLDESYQFRQDTDFVLDNLTGIETLEYSLHSGREDGITDPSYLHKVEKFAQWYRGQPEIAHVQAFPDVIKRLNKNMNGDDPAFLRIPDDPNLAAQYLLLYELSLPQGVDLNDRMDISKSETRLTATVRGRLPSKQVRELDERAQRWLQENMPEIASEATGFAVATAYMSQRNINRLLVGMSVAMGLISIILLLVFRSIRLGLISLVPNFVPLTMSFGLWGYAVGDLGLGGTITCVIAFGIVVDDTVHFLSRYQEAKHEGLSASDAVRATFQSVGNALWTTTLALSAGFLVLALSGVTSSQTLGIMVAITLVIALIADFLLLPSLLIATDKKKSEGPGQTPSEMAGRV
ncbi:MAG: MMPL family transporter [Gammaproteobacteria bacterium]|nr:MMPL family transporter [Gammaproteobacteria bacterium]